jgi:hypothetical protein
LVIEESNIATQGPVVVLSAVLPIRLSDFRNELLVDPSLNGGIRSSLHGHDALGNHRQEADECDRTNPNSQGYFDQGKAA